MLTHQALDECSKAMLVRSSHSSLAVAYNGMRGISTVS